MDMGTGKTVTTLTAFTDMMASFDARRMLVVAPLRVASRVWSDEVKQWEHLQHLTVSRIVGTEAQRLKALQTPADIHTINRENLTWLEPFFLSAGGMKQIRRFPWDTVVLDESQSFKSQSSQRYDSAYHLRHVIPRLVELTGTPSPNGYSDLWSQIHLLDRGARLGNSESAYRDRWFDPPRWEKYKWTVKPGAKEHIQRAISDIVLTLRAEDYLDLPEVKRNFIRVTLSPTAMKKYREMERSSLVNINDRVITAVNAAILSGKLLQLANGAIYYGEQRQWELLHDHKIHALLETLEGFDSPTLIGYTFQSDRDRIAAALDAFCGKRRSWLPLKTNASFDHWRTGLVDFGLIHPASAGHGLNDLYLSGAENIVWFGPTNNLEWYLQLNARLTGGHRRQGRSIVIHHIIADNTFDEDAMALLDYKDVDQADLKLQTSLLQRAGRL